MGEAGRKSFNQVLSGIGIFLVVLGHSSGVLPEKAAIIASGNPWYFGFLQILAWIYTFHMPLFFMLSGMNYAEFTLPKTPSYVQLLRSKACRLLFPYLTISTLAYPVKAVLSRLALRPIDLSFGSYFTQIFYPWENSIVFFWFLPTLFLCFAVAPLLTHARSVGGRVTLVCGLLAASFLFPHHPVKEEWLALGNLGGVLHNLIYFYLGIELVRLGLTSVSRSIWTLAILTGFYVLQGYLHSIEIATFIFTLIGISGCLVCGHFLSGSNLLSSLGRYSYQIYLFSWFFQIPARIVFGQIWCPSIWLAVTASLGAGILGPIVLTRFLEKVAPKWLSTLYGT